MKILIVGTPRTGNTWVKRCLSLIYDLPVVDFSLPEFWRPFDAHPYDQLGHRWIAHQHLPPFDSIVRWARDRNVILITTTRHPADTLVSLYHYARNFGARGEIERETLELLQMSDKQDKREANSTSSNGLQAYVREKFFKTLHFSIAWLQRRFSYGIRYESLWDKPFETIETLTNQISPVSCQHIRDCLEKCQLEQMRKDAQGDAAFFRGGGLGNWKTSLPAEIVEMLRHLSPYASQIEWLGYRLDDYPIASIPPTLTLRSPPARTALSFLGPTFMMMRKSTFHDLKGFNEHFFTIYQDLDLCLRLRESGLRIIWTPQAVLLHHESLSRQKYYDVVDRYLLLDQWQDTIEGGDPYYNPNLNLDGGDYSLRSNVC